MSRSLLPGEHLVLGLLGVRPMHGYEMARLLSQEELVTVCPVEQSLLYTYLRNLEDRELVRWEERRVGNRPPRKLYELTASGRDALRGWLAQPVGRIREIRLEFLLKLYFLHQSNPSAERELLARQVVVCEEYEQRLARGMESQTGFPRLVAQSKLSAVTATLSWLRAYEQECRETPPQESRVANPHAS